MRESGQVFIAYSHADREAADMIAAALSEAGINVWMDTGIAPGREWVAALERGMRESAVFLILVSPALVESEWMMYELGFMLSEYRARRTPVIPVLLRPAPMPEVLRDFQMIDSSRRPLPNAIPGIVGAITHALAATSSASSVA
jgi:hypothetical protein